MTREETKSCIGTIEMLQRLAYNIHGVMDVVDADNCKKIIKALEQEPCDAISRQAAIDALDTGLWGAEWDKALATAILKDLPSAQPETEWNNHTVACLLAELFGDACACNYNGIDEWLPEKCEVIDACPNPVGVACWEQFLKHRAGRRADE